MIMLKNIILTQSDILRFEVGEGFNILSPAEISENERIYEQELREQEEDYGYSGDSPYYDAVREWCHYMYHKYFTRPEEFINAILRHNDWNTFGWALNSIKENTILHKYAKKYMKEFILNDSAEAEFSDEEIEEILNDKTLPS